ncbi:ornithine carbamoyltransferase [Enterobacteriaceae endosymbiont of Macroplea mutica]|uniref:ornithine carbamoyltransferase n=1 Tax=Enterobacteriaceae endosymbiont of Macroplea mutica TaxID=2675791 RepID=UPI001449806D|nr:ornithine carbamoyltransferase [Enterobacteriaceae endosymbiont of Macroplea mutica]QJC31189.1 ornithine carbamoyltransferase [Enterobacteriaceae endosymbiont of Macroplea mutica]
MHILYQKNILHISNLTKKTIFNIIELATKMKIEKKLYKEKKRLCNKNILLIFEQNSTRTRCSFEIACFDQGANVTFLNVQNTHMGYKETIQDTAVILSHMYDGIQYRGTQKNIEILSQYSIVPIWNGLTEISHPTQILADLLTIRECLPNKNLEDIVLTYIGDIYNNISMSLIEAAQIIGFKLNLITSQFFLKQQKYFFLKKKINFYSNIIITYDINHIKNTDIIYTDVWLSMGESTELWEQKITNLYKYQINKKLLLKSENDNIKIMHCLPAYHVYDHYKNIIDNKIISRLKLFDGLEITDEIFTSYNSIILQQAINKIHIVKAIMILTLNKNNN